MNRHSGFAKAELLGLNPEPSALEHYIARDKAFRGIGPVRAAALRERFGSRLRDALVSVTEEVIELIGEEAALCAAAAMEVRSAETGLLIWLDNVGARIPAPKAICLARAWGEQGLEAIQSNPYLLLAISEWSIVDKIGQALGVAKHDTRREVAALEAALAGEDLPRPRDKRIGLAAGDTRVLRNEALYRTAELLGCAPSKDLVARAVHCGAAVMLGEDLQPPGSAHMEAECALLMARLAVGAPSCGATEEGLLESLLDDYEATQPFPLTEPQREAVRMAHRHRVYVLGGYAGSGKTTALRGVCHTLEAVHRKPLIVTLSGRAAQRAAEATGRRAITVARFLLEQKKADGDLASDCALIADR